MDLQNNPMTLVKFDYRFKSAGTPDSTSPTASVSPDSSTPVSTNTSIIISFDEAILESTLQLDSTIKLFDISGNSNNPVLLNGAYIYGYNSASNKVILSPVANFKLADSSSYKITLTNAITDTLGNNLATGTATEVSF